MTVSRNGRADPEGPARTETHSTSKDTPADHQAEMRRMEWSLWLLDMRERRGRERSDAA